MKTNVDYANNGNVRMDAGYHFKNKVNSNSLYFLIVACFALLVVFSGCEKDMMPTPEGNVKVTGVSLGQTMLTLEADETKTLTATVEPANAANKDVTWTSSNDVVATVANGVVKAVAIGTATITVTTNDGGHKATCTVTVGPPKQMTMTTVSDKVEFYMFGSGTVNIDWGDGSATETYTLKTNISFSPENLYTHSYSNASSNNITITGANITNLYCDSNQLTSLDVSKNTELTQLDCRWNQLTNLNVSSNTRLRDLDCTGNQLEILDVSKNTVLFQLYCSVNQLTGLDVSNNTKLRYLTCGENQLTSIDVSKNPELILLGCDGNPLTSLDVSNNTALGALSCSGNQLTSLDVSKNIELEQLWCNYNLLKELDVSKNTALTMFDCADNQLTELGLTYNTALKSLYCENNQLTELDMSSNTVLTDLKCSMNQLTKLDLSNNTLLKNLYCDNNQLDADALNALFKTLHDKMGEKSIFIYQNIGSFDPNLNKDIAITKGWSVYNW